MVATIRINWVSDHYATYGKQKGYGKDGIRFCIVYGTEDTKDGSEPDAYNLYEYSVDEKRSTFIMSGTKGQCKENAENVIANNCDW